MDTPTPQPSAPALADWVKDEISNPQTREQKLIQTINRMASTLESVTANIEKAKAEPFGGSTGAILSMLREESAIGRLVVAAAKDGAK